MIKQRKAYTAVGGFGDLFMVLPEIERMGKVHLILPPYHSTQGVPGILERAIPDARIEFDEFDERCRRYPDIVYRHHVRRAISRHSCRGKLRLSAEAIARFDPLPGFGEILIVHPVSGGLDRRYDRWAEVDWGGVGYRIVGYPGETGGLQGDVYPGDFVDVARLLRGSLGLVCVDSCVMHLANLVGVPSLAIYHARPHYMFVPNDGRGLLRPEPVDISHRLHELRRRGLRGSDI